MQCQNCKCKERVLLENCGALFCEGCLKEFCCLGRYSEIDNTNRGGYVYHCPNCNQHHLGKFRPDEDGGIMINLKYNYVPWQLNWTLENEEICEETLPDLFDEFHSNPNSYKFRGKIKRKVEKV